MKNKLKLWDEENKCWLHSPHPDYFMRWEDDICILGEENQFIKPVFFTGYQDKNGKDIYFGDVLYKEGHHNRIVVWSNGAWAVEYLKRDIENKWTRQNKPRLKDFVHNTEVIGNIFESSLIN